MEIRTVTFSIKLGCSQAAGNLFATLHEISVKRPVKSCRPTGIHIRVYFRDIPDMVAELYGQIPEETDILEFADTGRKTGPGRAHVIYMDPEESREVRIKDEGLVLVMTGEDRAPVSRIESQFHEPSTVMEVHLFRIVIHLGLPRKHPGRENGLHHALFFRVERHFQHLVSSRRIPQEPAAQEVDLVVAGFCRRVPHILAVFGKDHLRPLQ